MIKEELKIGSIVFYNSSGNFNEEFNGFNYIVSKIIQIDKVNDIIHIVRKFSFESQFDNETILVKPEQLHPVYFRDYTYEEAKRLMGEFFYFSGELIPSENKESKIISNGIMQITVVNEIKSILPDGTEDSTIFINNDPLSYYTNNTDLKFHIYGLPIGQPTIKNPK